MLAKNVRYVEELRDTLPALPLWDKQNIRKYSLFQGILLTVDYLRSVYKEVLSDEELYERIEFIANPSLGFPTCDIEYIEFFTENGQVRARMRINPLGLIGANSPMPIFYSEQALGESTEEDNTTRDFLNFFNDRLQRLLLPIWKKYRYYAFYKAGALDSFSAKLFSLIGLGPEALRKSNNLNWKRLLPYLGMISLRAHSGVLVEAVLRYYFKHKDIFVEQCVERRVKIADDQLNRLGQANSAMGDTLVIGTEVRDRSGKFRIHILKLTWDQFHRFLPINDEYGQLNTLVGFILRDPLEYDIKLQLLKHEIKDLRIGSNSECLLGWTSWLGKDMADGKILLKNQM